MSAADALPAPTAVDRRALLRATATLLAGAAVVSLAEPLRGGAVSWLTPTSVLPDMAVWSGVIGDAVRLTTAQGLHVQAHVADVRDVARAGADQPLGVAYSVLLDVPGLPATHQHAVTVLHRDIPRHTLTVLPVGGHTSWEAIIDTRRPTT